MKISTVKTKVNQLKKLNLDNLEFGKVSDGKTEIDSDLKEIHKTLREFDKELNAKERDYVAHENDRELRNTFGDLTDLFNGDSDKAMQVYKSLLGNYINQKLNE